MDPDIVCVSETWLHGTDDYPNSLFLCAKVYDIYRSDRTDKQGGGVALLVKRCLNAQFLCSSQIDNGELLWVMIQRANVKLLVGSFYRSNVAAFSPMDKLFNDLESFQSMATHTLLLGDFNLPNIDWQTPNSPAIFKQDIFLEKFLQLGFTQFVTEPTRERNILDLVLCDSQNLVFDVRMHDPLSSSDHSTICFSFLFDFVHQNECKRNWHKCFYFGFQRALEFVPWNSLFQGVSSIDSMYDIFLSIFHELTAEFVPMTHFTRKSSKISKYSRSLLYKRRKALRVLRKKKSTVHKAKFNALNIAFSNSIRNDIKKFENSVVRNPNPRKFFAYVRSKMDYYQKVPALKKTDGTLTFSAADKANMFKDVFGANFRADDGVAQVFSRPKQGSTMPEVQITRTMVYEALKTFPNKISCGPDDIPALALKKMAAQLSVPLCTLFQYSLNNGEIPKCWKEAIVTPLYKGKGSVSDASNYRPISQTSNVCKAMEKIIKNHILEFLEATSAINKEQFGFMKRRSTLTQLLECLNIWTQSLDKGIPMDVIYLDVSKAFDTVNHQKLISKLDFYGIRSKWLDWIKAFLSHRSQKVRVDNSLSSVSDVLSGVPQGSVLGPLLFILYINDVVSVVQNSNIRLYADDGKIFFSVGSDEDFQALSDDINSVYHWLKSAQLSLALHKCEVLHLGYSNPHRPVGTDGNVFKPVKIVKDLGVYLSDDLRSSYHIDKIVAAAYSRTNCIFRTFTVREPGFLCRLFCVYVRPILEYNTPAWNPYLHKDIHKIESVQRFFTRRIPGFSKFSYNDRLAKLGMETLELRRLKFDLVEVYKIINGIDDLDYNQFFSICRDSFTRGNGLKLFVPYARLNVRKFFFSVRVVKLWNYLPCSATNSISVNVFKTEIDRVSFQQFLLI